MLSLFSREPQITHDELYYEYSRGIRNMYARANGILHEIDKQFMLYFR